MKVAVKMISREFVDKVVRGTKRMTIRPARKVPHQIGDVLDLRCWEGRPYWSGQIHLGLARVIAYYPITIRAEGFAMDGVFTPRPKDLQRLAKTDGFTSWAALLNWFGPLYSLPFDGFVTEWKLIPIHVHDHGYRQRSKEGKIAMAKMVHLAARAVVKGQL